MVNLKMAVKIIIPSAYETKEDELKPEKSIK